MSDIDRVLATLYPDVPAHERAEMARGLRYILQGYAKAWPSSYLSQEENAHDR